MTETPHGTATITVTINRARHALLTAVSWADPAGLGLPLALAQSQADRSGRAGKTGKTDQTAARAPEVRASTSASTSTSTTSPARSKGRAARRRRSAVRG
ncbi:hypothetical protein OG217_20260 [Streptomyces sp. NBC_01023]|uniref:hypothetical protein n=1 Tax=Streptomyces sp. NBC_01023 TaxID=2903724 RepID=UPI0038642775|nr:hypothetical protein OG217_20260 [Streptomyces sp. NBC_01023]